MNDEKTIYLIGIDDDSLAQSLNEAGRRYGYDFWGLERENGLATGKIVPNRKLDEKTAHKMKKALAYAGLNTIKDTSLIGKEKAVQKYGEFLEKEAKREKVENLAAVLNKVGEKYHPDLEWKVADIDGTLGLMPVGNPNEETSRKIREVLTTAGLYGTKKTPIEKLDIERVGTIYREYFDGTYSNFESLATILNAAGTKQLPDYKWVVDNKWGRCELDLVDKNGKGVDRETAHKVGNALANAGVMHMDPDVALCLNLEVKDLGLENLGRCIEGLRLHFGSDKEGFVLHLRQGKAPFPSLARMSRLGQGYSKKLQEEYASASTKVADKLMSSSIVNKLKNVRF